MSGPPDFAEIVFEILFRDKEYFPSDWQTDDRITFGEWRAAINAAYAESRAKDKRAKPFREEMMK